MTTEEKILRFFRFSNRTGLMKKKLTVKLFVDIIIFQIS